MGWTDERVSTLKKLWLEGLSASQIAKQLGGVTRNAVIGKVQSVVPSLFVLQVGVPIEKFVGLVVSV